MNIDVNCIEPNPYQTRIEYDPKTFEAIKASLLDNIGLRNAILVRPHPDRENIYQIASGETRWRATKENGSPTIVAKVADLTELDMKREVITENTLRRNLNEDELYNAVEQVRQELGGNAFPIRDLATYLHVSHTTINHMYEVRRMRDELSRRNVLQDNPPNRRQILETASLPTDDRVNLLQKAQKNDWSSRTVKKVKESIRNLDPEVKDKVLDINSLFTPNTIAKVATLEPEKQKPVVNRIATQRLREDDAVKLIDRAKADTLPQINVTVDEARDTLNDIREVLRKAELWGYPHYMILGVQNWDEACAMFTQIEEQMRWLKTRGWEN